VYALPVVAKVAPLARHAYRLAPMSTIAGILTCLVNPISPHPERPYRNSARVRVRGLLPASAMEDVRERRRTELRARLLARLEELRQRTATGIVPEPEETFSGIAGEVQDAGDSSVALERTSLRGVLAGRDAAERTAVERAIDRMQTGSYGRCIDCDLEIHPARLKVVPTAERCSDCQDLFERRAPAAALR
jgi:RNA polymerase-binding transcription factor DksA